MAPPTPYRRPILMQRDRMRMAQIDPQHLAALTFAPPGPGLVDSPFNIPDANQHENNQQISDPLSTPGPHLAPARTGPVQKEGRLNNHGFRLMDVAAGSKVRGDTQNPTSTVAGGEVTLRYRPSALHLYIENNSAVTVNWNLDDTANPGRGQVLAGDAVSIDMEFSELHLFCASAVAINGDAAGALFILANG